MNFDKRLAFRGIRALYGNDGFEKFGSSTVDLFGK
jgi:tRNA A37 threonylcarbamoyladenosine dehydratase